MENNYLDQYGKTMLANEQRREKNANQMAKYFDKLALYINELFERWIDKYKDNDNNIDMNIANTKLTFQERLQLEREIKQYEKPNFMNVDSDEYKEYLLYYDKVVSSLNGTRQDFLNAVITLEIVAFYANMTIRLDETTIDEMQNEIDFLNKIMEQDLSDNENDLIKTYQPIKEDNKQSIASQRTVLIGAIITLIGLAIISNNSKASVKKAIKDNVLKSSARFKGLVRESVGKGQINIQKQMYLKNGIDEYVFISETEMYKHISLGGRSTTKGKNLTPCPICAELNGQIFKVKNMKVGINAPLMHRNCRCSTAPLK